MDDEFRSWEVFVNTGPSGFSRPPGIGFRCISDPAVSSRMTSFEGDPNEALVFVESAEASELLGLLAGGVVLS
jgi:hypothetical protein